MESLTTQDVGELCVRGDSACERGDFAMLGYIADLLAMCAHEPLLGKLAAIAAITRGGRGDREGAIAAWLRLKERLALSAT